MVLSGDDLTTISPERLEMLRKLLPPTGVAAKFEDDSLSIGMIDSGSVRRVCLFNWEDQPKTFRFKLHRFSDISEYWSGEKFGKRDGWFSLDEVPARSARLIVCQ
jgi:alpha-galactosidase